MSLFLQEVGNMKIKIDTEKILNIFESYIKYIPVTLATIVVVIFLGLSYFALFPRLDSNQIIKGEEKVKSLDIRFNMKLLGELSATKTPTQLGTAGGRDPFAGF